VRSGAKVADHRSRMAGQRGAWRADTRGVATAGPSGGDATDAATPPVICTVTSIRTRIRSAVPSASGSGVCGRIMPPSTTASMMMSCVAVSGSRAEPGEAIDDHHAAVVPICHTQHTMNPQSDTTRRRAAMCIVVRAVPSCAHRRAMARVVGFVCVVYTIAYSMAGARSPATMVV